jgi:hypothetical protein
MIELLSQPILAYPSLFNTSRLKSHALVLTPNEYFTGGYCLFVVNLLALFLPLLVILVLVLPV